MKTKSTVEQDQWVEEPTGGWATLEVAPCSCVCVIHSVMMQKASFRGVLRKQSDNVKQWRERYFEVGS